jgi:hypothetical protein
VGEIRVHAHGVWSKDPMYEEKGELTHGKEEYKGELHTN